MYLQAVSSELSEVAPFTGATSALKVSYQPAPRKRPSKPPKVRQVAKSGQQTAPAQQQVQQAPQQEEQPQDAGVETPRGVPLFGNIAVTSLFGYRSSPFGETSEFHNGVDFAVPMGTPIYATARGTISEMGFNPVFGLMVLIDHHNGYSTLYGHMSAARVERGEFVEAGEQIGDVGSSGRSTGPHVHYTVYQYGTAVDPAPFVAGEVP